MSDEMESLPLFTICLFTLNQTSRLPPFFFKVNSLSGKDVSGFRFHGFDVQANAIRDLS